MPAGNTQSGTSIATATAVCIVASKGHQGEPVLGCWNNIIDEREGYLTGSGGFAGGVTWHQNSSLSQRAGEDAVELLGRRCLCVRGYSARAILHNRPAPC